MKDFIFQIGRLKLAKVQTKNKDKKFKIEYLFIILLTILALFIFFSSSKSNSLLSFATLNNQSTKNTDLENKTIYIKNGMTVKKHLAKRKIYVATLWPNVLETGLDIETEFTENILPLPCDQRYSVEDMQRVADEVKELM